MKLLIKFLYIALISLFALSAAAFAKEIKADVNNDGVKEIINILDGKVEVNDQNGGSIDSYDGDFSENDNAKVVTNKKGQVVIIEQRNSSPDAPVKGLFIIGFSNNQLTTSPIIATEYKIQDLNNDGNYELVAYLPVISSKPEEVSNDNPNVADIVVVYNADNSNANNLCNGTRFPVKNITKTSYLLPYIFNLQTRKDEALSSPLYKTAIGQKLLSEWMEHSIIVWGSLVLDKCPDANKAKDMIQDVVDEYGTKEDIKSFRKQMAQIEKDLNGNVLTSLKQRAEQYFTNHGAELMSIAHGTGTYKGYSDIAVKEVNHDGAAYEVTGILHFTGGFSGHPYITEVELYIDKDFQLVDGKWGQDNAPTSPGGSPTEIAGW